MKRYLHYLRVRVSCPAERQEELIPSMAELGCGGFEQTDDHLIGYFPTSEDEPGRLGGKIEATLRTISSQFDISITTLEDRNWNEEWERTVGPVEIGERFIVAPSWRLPLPAAGRTLIVIDPKMSFGTGYHETTRLMLRLIERTVAPGDSVLDVGTGTGILAIAAALIGASGVTATDTDDWSMENAMENTARNGVAGTVAVIKGTLPEPDSRNYDVICANITLNDIVALLPGLAGRLSGGGMLLLSGFMAADAPAIGAGLESNGLVMTGSVSENEWIAVSAVRA